MTDSAFSEQRPEFALINWIAGQSRPSTSVSLGIGDDAAVLKSTTDEWVVTKDVITEGVHFDSLLPLSLVGRKALAVNLSDIAAMGARPVAAFTGVVFPKTMTREQAEEICKGIQDLANEWNVTIAGGDTNSWDGPLVISVTLLGTVSPGTAIRRSGAQVGDWIFVTGPLGGSLHSERHARFTPRLREAERLRELVTLHSMMDLSDGLGSDLFHLLKQSQVGARIDGAAIPIHQHVDQTLSPMEKLLHALGDGEDFELLFTVSEEDGKKLIANPRSDVQTIHIGEIVESHDAVLVWEGKEHPFPRSGWSHSFGNFSSAS